jgi:putative lipoic acid-binding regulatory protein
METFGDRTPEIDYPTTWSYTVIGSDDGRIRFAISEIVGEREHQVRSSRRSEHGRYTSWRVDVRVADNEERLAIFKALHEHPDIRYVL